MVAALPFPPSADLVERAARGYAFLAVRTRWLPLFHGSRVPTNVPGGSDRRVIEDRFVLKMLSWVDEVRPLSFGRAPGFAVEVHGRERLAAAFAEGRGVILVTGHFGFPPAIRVALDATGTSWLALRQFGLREGGLSLGGDPWARVRTLRRAREALGRNQACVILADGGHGAVARVPFLEGQLGVSLGAFALARASGCPVVPFFVPLVDGPRRLRVEIEAPLPRSMPPGEDPVDGAVRSFARLYETYVRRYPSSVYWGASSR